MQVIVGSINQQQCGNAMVLTAQMSACVLCFYEVADIEATCNGN